LGNRDERYKLDVLVEIDDTFFKTHMVMRIRGITNLAGKQPKIPMYL
jgi:hypothetical protein